MKIRHHFFLYCGASLFSIGLLFAQGGVDTIPVSPWKFTGYSEVFFSYHSRALPHQKNSEFQYNHNRFKRLKLNQAHLEAVYTKSNFRMNFALQSGTYVKDNYAAEPALPYQ
jgi:hypothetical protein